MLRGLQFKQLTDANAAGINTAQIFRKNYCLRVDFLFFFDVYRRCGGVLVLAILVLKYSAIAQSWAIFAQQYQG